MFGEYDGFPEIRHRVVQFLYRVSKVRLQESVIKTLYRLNERRRGFRFSSIPSVLGCKVLFDFGIADGLTFNYLNEETVKLSLEIVSKRSLPTLDFLCIVRYYKRIGRRKYRPLRFDYYILRFQFYNGSGDIQIYHEKGIRRISIEDLIEFIIQKINEELARDKQPKILLKYEGRL